MDRSCGGRESNEKLGRIQDGAIKVFKGGDAEEGGSRLMELKGDPSVKQSDIVVPWAEDNANRLRMLASSEKTAELVCIDVG